VAPGIHPQRDHIIYFDNRTIFMVLQLQQRSPSHTPQWLAVYLRLCLKLSSVWVVINLDNIHDSKIMGINMELVPPFTAITASTLLGRLSTH
jgi:hypothetical protein